MDTEHPQNLRPKRVAIFLTAVDSGEDGDLRETVARVSEDAESRGLFFEWAAIGDMSVEEVIQGSPLHQALLGHPPDR
jgi:hypothetical protein